MANRFESNDDSGDFSVCFSDMLFGLLFFFFIMALAMVFNRSDIVKFVDQADKRDKEIKATTERNQELERRLKDAEAMLAELQKKYEKNRKLFETTFAQNDELKKQVEEQRKQLEELERRKRKVDDLLAKDRSLVDTKVEEANRQFQNMRDKRNELLKKMDDRDKLDAMRRDMMQKIKQMLSQSGNLDLLAEVDNMNKKIESPSTTPEQGKDKPPIDITSIHVKLDAGNQFSYTIKEGDAPGGGANAVDDASVVDAAKKIVDDYKTKSDGYSDDDKAKYTPRMYLMSNPDVTKREETSFLKKISGVIPVNIVDWTGGN